jgi:hypothetical protein
MSQINVNPGGGPGPVYRDESAGIGLVGIVLVLVFIVVLAVLAYGAVAGHWFGTTGLGGNTTTNVNVSAPAAPQQRPGGNTNINVNLPSPATSPAAQSPAAAPAASR